ncbi:FMN-binding negative transcriptional regulator [Rubrolithibacter danxiaensis]|uniref:FMN-binding negative transcriptional regulator n=1 Tax=Rubrolithibacter danxiaensis TaxID=3390805 RepID=UPI003BF8152D
MYIPKNFLMADKEEIVSFMKKFSFASIITVKDDSPVATHLPFIITTKNDQVVLTSHFAKANEQWKEITDNQNLIIFAEPHAYISPSNYEKELNVPTWNYIAVHAYGKARLITEPQQMLAVLEHTITTYEAGYKQQWDSLPEDYKLKMLKGIVAFEIVVTDLQGKKKLSQNKTESERLRVIESLKHSTNGNERLIADYMKENLVNKE